MIRPLTGFLVLESLALGLWALGAALARRTPGPAYTAALVILQVLLVGHAVLDVGSLLAGHRVPDLATHLGYVAGSVGLLPVLLGDPRSARHGGPGVVAVAVVACAAVTVVLFRQWATWLPAHA